MLTHMPRFTRTFLVLLALLTTASAYEHVMLSGGPALRKLEDYRVVNDRHDRWWANFIRAATLQMDIIRSQYGPDDTITWYVYRSAYDLRGREDGKPYTSWIAEQASKRGAKLVWISSGSQFISKMNALPAGKTKTFNYFGHSNKHCFLLDYSSQVLGASAAWLHENQLSSLNGRPFSKSAICKSWGCYTGESMSKYWRQATGIKLIGAKGKTDYEALSFGRMPDINGRWTY